MIACNPAIAIPICDEPSKWSDIDGPVYLIVIHCTPDVETDADGKGVSKFTDVVPDSCDS